MAAAEEIAHTAADYIGIVTKSTVPVRTNRKVKQVVQQANPNLDFEVVSNPEFLREGAAIDNLIRPDRVVLGVQTDRAADVMGEIYRPLFPRDFPIVTTDLESAEMIKYLANAFLATNITFINEMAALCEKVGADIKQVRKGMGLDGRIANKFLHAVPMQITETVSKVNEETKRRMIDKLLDLCDGTFNGKPMAVLGVTFKPNTDDMRDASSLSIVPALVGGGAKVPVTDPQGRHEGEALLPGVNCVKDAYKASHNADFVVILTAWNEFRGIDLRRWSGT